MGGEVGDCKGIEYDTLKEDLEELLKDYKESIYDIENCRDGYAKENKNLLNKTKIMFENKISKLEYLLKLLGEE